jgi:hypothetical protein
MNCPRYGVLRDYDFTNTAAAWMMFDCPIKAGHRQLHSERFRHHQWPYDVAPGGGITVKWVAELIAASITACAWNAKRGFA